MTEEATFSRCKMKKARKSYTCCECGSSISPGDEYEYFWGVWEFRAGTFRTCCDCAKIRAEFFRETGEVWAFEELWDSVREYIQYSDFDDVKNMMGLFSFTAGQQDMVDKWLDDADPWCAAGCGREKESFSRTCSDAYCVAAAARLKVCYGSV